MRADHPAGHRERVDERTDKSSTDTGIGHGTETPLHRRTSVSLAAAVTVAARAWRALDHLGSCARCYRHRARCAARRANRTALDERRKIAVRPCESPDTHAIIDTYRMTPAYDQRSSALDYAAMPNTSSRA
jgi:hypothetical protein